MGVFKLQSPIPPYEIPGELAQQKRFKSYVQYFQIVYWPKLLWIDLRFYKLKKKYFVLIAKIITNIEWIYL